MNQHFNSWLGASGLLMILTVFIHIFAGGPEILVPTRASELAPVIVSVLSVIWHAITWILILIAAALIWTAMRPNRGVVVLTVAIQLGLAALFVLYGLSDLGSLMQMPQWIIFTSIPALTIVGLARDGASL